MQLINNKIFFNIIYCLTLLMLINSCGINSNIMFKTPKGKEFKFDSIPMRPDTEYKIAPDDRLKFYIYPNQGGRLIENLSGTSALIENQLRSGNTLYRIEDYLVRIDGFVNLPIIGDLKVVDLTVKQLEDTLCKYYALQFNQPFVKVELTNKRCIIFTGDGSEAKIIPLNNSNTTLIEALAQAGGIDPRGQAKNIKMIRNIIIINCMDTKSLQMI